MGLMSNNPFPSMLYVEQGSTPASPASGDQRLFVRSSDHVLCMVNSSGTVTALSGSLTNPMTTEGDIIRGGASGAPTRVAVGTAGFGLVSDGTDPVWAEILPWHILIVPMVETPDASSGSWALNAFGDNAIQYPWYQPGSAANSGGANSWISGGTQNESNDWIVVLAKGTWTANFWVRKASTNGIITLNQDTVSQGTVDTYAASVAAAKVSISGWTVATTGKHTMQIKMATKNASASNYFAELFAIEFQRTA